MGGLLEAIMIQVDHKGGGASKGKLVKTVMRPDKVIEKILLITSGSSIMLIIRINPWHLGQGRGSTSYIF
jgi:hypothetical protein